MPPSYLESVPLTGAPEWGVREYTDPYDVFSFLLEEGMADAPLKDKDYDLVSVVYHASQGVETSQRYATEAKADGDGTAASLFEEAHMHYAELVKRGKELLKERL